jgi:hypothetical protein
LANEGCLMVCKKLIILNIALLLLTNIAYVSAQETNSHVSGIVKSEKNVLLSGATIIAVHEPTKNVYSTKTNASGYFYFFNLRPSGVYTIDVSYIGYEPVRKTTSTFIFLHNERMIFLNSL